MKNRWDAKWAHPEAVEAEHWVTNLITDPRGFKEMTPEEIEGMRSAFREPIKPVYENKEDPLYADTEWKDYYTEHGCPEEKDTPPVHIIVGRPEKLKAGKKIPAVFCITGGGLTGGGTAELGLISTRKTIKDSGQKVVHVCFEYRTAPGHPYPAAVNDCHAAYLWMIEHAEELQIDTDRIVIHGGSTGGHLAWCLSFRLKRYRWCNAPMPRGVIITVPIMDDVIYNDSGRYSFVSPKSGKTEGWDHICCSENMKLWLGDLYGEPDLSPEAVPNRATLEDVKGFPPVWIPVESEFEPGRDSVYKMVSLLHEADVFCELHVWGGTNHGGAGTEGALAERQAMVSAGALGDALRYDFRRMWLLEE